MGVARGPRPRVISKSGSCSSLPRPRLGPEGEPKAQDCAMNWQPGSWHAINWGSSLCLPEPSAEFKAAPNSPNLTKATPSSCWLQGGGKNLATFQHPDQLAHQDCWERNCWEQTMSNTKRRPTTTTASGAPQWTKSRWPCDSVTETSDKVRSSQNSVQIWVRL